MASAFQVLERGYAYFFLEDSGTDLGVIAYVETRNYWVVAGGSIGSQRRLIAAARAEAQTRGRSLLFVACEQDTITELEKLGAPFDVIGIGRQPEWNPANYHISGPDRRSLRAQINRAKNKGVRVRESRRGTRAIARVLTLFKLSMSCLVGKRRDEWHAPIYG